MTIPTEFDRHRGPSHPEIGAGQRVSIERRRDTAGQARRFLEHARTDPRFANIVIQLAESVGDRIDSLPGYIDRLVAISSSLLRFTELEGDSSGMEGRSASEHAKYLGWFAALGMLERRL